MESAPLEVAALVGIRSIRQVSQEAAAAIELIYAAFGSHAALRAGLMIMKLKREVQQTGWTPNFERYASLLEDYPNALPLAKYAVTCWLQGWGIASAEAPEFA